MILNIGDYVLFGLFFLAVAFYIGSLLKLSGTSEGKEEQSLRLLTVANGLLLMSLLWFGIMFFLQL